MKKLLFWLFLLSAVPVMAQTDQPKQSAPTETSMFGPASAAQVTVDEQELFLARMRAELGGNRIIAAPAPVVPEVDQQALYLARMHNELRGGYGPYVAGNYNSYYDYGYYGYAFLEPCRNFPGNRSCIMGKVKIDYEQTFDVIRGVLSQLGLPGSTAVDMYTARIDEATGKQLSVLVNNGAVTKHNNFFNKPYRLEAGTYKVQFVIKSGQNLLFEDYIKVLPEYFTHGETQVLQVSATRFANEPDRAVIQKQPPAQLTLQQWRQGGGK